MDSLSQSNQFGDNNFLTLNQYQSVSDEDLLEHAKSLLRAICHREIETSTLTLRSIRLLSNLSPSATQLLHVLESLQGLSQQSKVRKTYFTETIQYLRTAKNVELTDIAQSLLIRVESKNNPEQARERSESNQPLGPYSAEAFYELVADTKTCLLVWSEKKLELTEQEVCGLFRGLLRNEHFSNIEDVSDYLVTNFPSLNTNILNLLAKTIIWQLSLKQNHYWSITPEQHHQAHAIASEWAQILEKIGYVDYRVIETSTNLLRFLMGEHEELRKACWKNIDAVESYDALTADHLRLIFETNPSLKDELFKEIRRFDTDKKYREAALEKIVSKSEISAAEATLLSQFGSKKHVNDWYQNGAQVCDVDELASAIRALELAVEFANGNPQSSQKVRAKAEALLKTFENRMKMVSPHVLQPLAERVLGLGLPDTAVKLLAPVIPKCDSLWSSQLVCTYLHALHLSHQHKTLFLILERIDEEQRNANVWYLAGKAYQHIEQLDQAIDAFSKAINLYPQSSTYWAEWASTYEQSGADKAILLHVSSQIPASVFALNNQPGLWLMQFAIRHNRDIEVLNIALEQFVKLPQEMYFPLSELWISLLSSGHEYKLDQVNSDNVLGAVIFILQGERRSRLIVKNATSNEWLLDADEPIAQKLLSMNLGDIETHQFRQLELLEKPIPIMLAFSFASEQRTLSQRPGDCFLLLHTANEPEAMLNQFRDVVEHYGQPTEDLYAKAGVPLFMKFRRGGLSLRESIYAQLSVSTYREGLPSIGETKVEAAVCDLHTLVYLAVTGLYKAEPFCKIQLFITRSTKKALEDGLSELSSPDLLLLHVTKNHLMRTTSDDLSIIIGDYIQGLRDLFQASTVIQQGTGDMPIEITQVLDIFDESVISSMSVCFLQGLAYLTIDATLASLVHYEGGRVVNLSELTLLHSGISNYSQRKQAIRAYVTHGMPVAVTERDLLDLAQTGDDEDFWILTEFLKNHPAGIIKHQNGLEILWRVMICALSAAKIKYPQTEDWCTLSSPWGKGLIERLLYTTFRLSMQIDTDRTSERRLLNFLEPLVYIHRNDAMVVKFISFCAGTFARGHFLDMDYLIREFKIMHVSRKK